VLARKSPADLASYLRRRFDVSMPPIKITFGKMDEMGNERGRQLRRPFI
jgi:hypothetical protein